MKRILIDAQADFVRSDEKGQTALHKVWRRQESEKRTMKNFVTGLYT